jgi:hypothetical protein
MASSMRRLLAAEDFMLTEPFLSIFETGMVNAFIFVGHACADRVLLDAGYSLVQRCQELLNAKRERRDALSLPVRPDSECWYRTFGLLAELKWKGPAALRDRLMTPEHLIDEFNAVEQRCLSYLIEHPSQDASRDEKVKAGLGWYGLQVVKMAMTWCPKHKSEMIERFNEIHGDILRLETGHFMLHRSDNASNPWYWDFELFKWCVSGPATPDEAELCSQWRLDAARTSGMPADFLLAFRNASDRELPFLLTMQARQQAYAG